jgi:hypothetical protein
MRPKDNLKVEDGHADERLAIPLDPEEALRALLKVDPDAPPVEPKNREKPSDAAQ